MMGIPRTCRTTGSTVPRPPQSPVRCRCPRRHTTPTSAWLSLYVEADGTPTWQVVRRQQLGPFHRATWSVFIHAVTGGIGAQSFEVRKDFEIIESWTRDMDGNDLTG